MSWATPLNVAPCRVKVNPSLERKTFSFQLKLNGDASAQPYYHRHAESLQMTDMMAKTTSWPLLRTSKAEINSEIAKTESGPEWLRRLEHGNWLCACSTARVSLQVNAPCWQKEVSSRKVQESHSTYSTANFNANTHTHMQIIARSQCLTLPKTSIHVIELLAAS